MERHGIVFRLAIPWKLWNVTEGARKTIQDLADLEIERTLDKFSTGNVKSQSVYMQSRSI